MQNAETLALLGQIKILKATLAREEAAWAAEVADLKAQIASLQRDLEAARKVITERGRE